MNFTAHLKTPGLDALPFPRPVILAQVGKKDQTIHETLNKAALLGAQDVIARRF
jgi:hypothetical protein